MAKLEQICTINMGQSPDSSSYNEISDGLPFFQGNADFGELYPHVRIWCNAPTKVAKPNDILISVRAPIGALNFSNCNCCIGRGLAALTVNQEKCTEKYLWYVLSSKINELNSKGTGSTFKAINKKILSETEIPLPPLEEQRRIAATLDKVTDLISKRRQQLDKLDELVKARFVEMFEGKSFKIVKTCEVCEFITKGTTPPNTEIYTEYKPGRIPFLKVYNLSFTGSLLFDEHPQYISKEIHDGILSRSKVYPNDVLMNIVGPPLGKFSLVTSQFPEWNVNQAIAIFRSKPCICPRYLEFALMQPSVLRPFLNQAVGVRQLNLSLQQCRDLEICLPPIELQNQFATFVTQIDKLKATVYHSLEKLETLKKALMQEYFG